MIAFLAFLITQERRRSIAAGLDASLARRKADRAAGKVRVGGYVRRAR